MTNWADAGDKQAVIFKTLTCSILILAEIVDAPEVSVVCGLVHHRKCSYGINTQTGGSNVGLDGSNTNIRWQGYSGVFFKVFSDTVRGITLLFVYILWGE